MKRTLIKLIPTGLMWWGYFIFVNIINVNISQKVNMSTLNGGNEEWVANKMYTQLVDYLPYVLLAITIGIYWREIKNIYKHIRFKGEYKSDK